ncbi:DNA-dependent ATPase fun30 [Coemansia sp. RSA 1813]|nr:DNA-dependent ATPase fun30 [Coemansia sp. RSA 1843]KAJ2087322.1 DNA-dependent ATPase fun30 [Coemansia sp. RSA 986]KAJ2215714.1 DNA-dependent ATPase fun30 [Coemansia sp. RSA 487]KAJ2568460.1 DNA-dependent ATPase fun30 [Coemansia sp. RSA 1813]
MKKITDYMRRASPEALAPDTPETGHSSQSSTLEPTDNEELVVLQSSPGRPGSSKAIRVDHNNHNRYHSGQRDTKQDGKVTRLSSFNFRGGKPANLTTTTTTTTPQSVDSLPSSPLGLDAVKPNRGMLATTGTNTPLTTSSIDLTKMDIMDGKTDPAAFAGIVGLSKWGDGGDSDDDARATTPSLFGSKRESHSSTSTRKRRIADLDSPDHGIDGSSAQKRATPTYIVSESDSDGESVNSSATNSIGGARRGRLLRGSRSASRKEINPMSELSPQEPSAYRRTPARVQASILVDSDDDSLDEDAEGSGKFGRKFENIEPHVMQLFNEGTIEELIEKAGSTPAEAKIILGLRPFEDMDAIEYAMRKTRGVRLAIFNQYRDTVLGHAEVESVICQCADVYNQLKAAMKKAGVVSNEATGAVSIADGVELVQPEMINKAFSLKHYQLEGVEWLNCLRNANASGILADEMGLGKTFQVIAFLCRGLEEGTVRNPSLVVCPSSTLDNWMNECARFAPSLRVVAYYGSQAERSALQQELYDERQYDVLVTTYNVATGNKLDRIFLKKRKFHSLILDEGHMVKNCMSSRYKWLAQIRTPFRLLLTGTPLQNNLQELVSLLTFIMPQVFAESQPTLTHAFKTKPGQKRAQAQGTDSDDATAVSSVVPSGTQTPVAQSTRGPVDTQHIEQAKVLLRPFVLRRRKCDVLGDLPSKTEHIVKLDLTEYQRKLYDSVVTDAEAENDDDIRKNLAVLDTSNLDPSANGAKGQQGSSGSSASSWIGMFMNMRKAADHPLLLRSHYKDSDLKQMAKLLLREPDYAEANYQYVLEDMEVCSDFELHKICTTYTRMRKFQLSDHVLLDSAKVLKLKSIVDECIERGEKLLLFSQFTTMLNILESVFGIWKVEYRRLDGQTKVDERQAMIDEFNSEESTVPVFLLSTKAGGFGINLTSANVVVIYDSGNNPSEERQAEDRAHRVGQVKDVRVYKLIASSTIDEDILESSRAKQLVEHMFWF